ncbi:MAG: hypothetical protein AB7Q42_09450 [Acidimicrobiia bacterium]
MLLLHHIIIDSDDPRVGHADIACADNVGLGRRLAALGVPVGDADEALAVAHLDGNVVPTWSARSVRPCPTCTLVATTKGWAVAA